MHTTRIKKYSKVKICSLPLSGVEGTTGEEILHEPTVDVGTQGTLGGRNRNDFVKGSLFSVTSSLARPELGNGDEVSVSSREEGLTSFFTRIAPRLNCNKNKTSFYTCIEYKSECTCIADMRNKE